MEITAQNLVGSSRHVQQAKILLEHPESHNPPGEMLLEEFMAPLEISQNRLASNLRVPTGRINQIINGKDPSCPIRRYASQSISATVPNFG
jgi:hypothetical protein